MDSQGRSCSRLWLSETFGDVQARPVVALSVKGKSDLSPAAAGGRVRRPSRVGRTG